MTQRYYKIVMAKILKKYKIEFARIEPMHLGISKKLPNEFNALKTYQTSMGENRDAWSQNQSYFGLPIKQ